MTPYITTHLEEVRILLLIEISVQWLLMDG